MTRTRRDEGKAAKCNNINSDCRPTNVDMPNGIVWWLIIGLSIQLFRFVQLQQGILDECVLGQLPVSIGKLHLASIGRFIMCMMLFDRKYGINTFDWSKNNCDRSWWCHFFYQKLINTPPLPIYWFNQEVVFFALESRLYIVDERARDGLMGQLNASAINYVETECNRSNGCVVYFYRTADRHDRTSICAGRKRYGHDYRNTGSERHWRRTPYHTGARCTTATAICIVSCKSADCWYLFVVTK